MRLQLIILIFSIFIMQNSFGSFSSDELQQRWINVISLNFNENLKKETPIVEPKNTWTWVLELELLNEKFEIYRECLLYKVPEDRGTGVLKLLTKKSQKTCQAQAFEKGEIEIKGIFNFGFNIEKEKLSLILDDKIFTFEFHNLNSQNKNFLLGKKIEVSFTQKINHGDLCYDFNSKCQPVNHFDCHLCPEGTVDVVFTDCPGMYRKYCAKNSCGNKGEYACVRGLMATKYTGDLCIPDSPVGFCRKGLRVICQNSELMCE